MSDYRLPRPQNPNPLGRDPRAYYLHPELGGPWAFLSRLVASGPVPCVPEMQPMPAVFFSDETNERMEQS